MYTVVLENEARLILWDTKRSLHRGAKVTELCAAALETSTCSTRRQCRAYPPSTTHCVTFQVLFQPLILECYTLLQMIWLVTEIPLIPAYLA